MSLRKQRSCLKQSNFYRVPPMMQILSTDYTDTTDGHRFLTTGCSARARALAGCFGSARMLVYNTVMNRSIWRNPNFILLWVGQAVSSIGDYFILLAIPLFVNRLTGSVMLVGRFVVASGVLRFRLLRE